MKPPHTSLAPRVAILIPAFNSAATIGQTLESLLEQHVGLDRIAAVIVADDGSTDGTIDVARNAWRGTVPLQIIHAASNAGERENVNRAVSRVGADVDWLLLLHSDDLAKPNWLELMFSRIDHCVPTVASICSSWDEFSADGAIVTGEENPAREIELIEGTRLAIRSTLMRGCWWHISGCAIRTEAFGAIGPFRSDMPQVGDWEWITRCLAAGWSVEYIPRTLIRYRRHAQSVSSASFKVDRDIRESLRVVAAYRQALGAWDIASLRGRWLQACVRRFARGVLNRDWRRCVRAVGTASVVIRDAVSP